MHHILEIKAFLYRNYIILINELNLFIALIRATCIIFVFYIRKRK